MIKFYSLGVVVHDVVIPLWFAFFQEGGEAFLCLRRRANTPMDFSGPIEVLIDRKMPQIVHERLRADYRARGVSQNTIRQLFRNVEDTIGRCHTGDQPDLKCFPVNGG